MSEARLRELFQEYAADEPPLRLRPVDVMHAPRSGWRRPLAAAAAAVVVVAGAVGIGVARSNHGLTPVTTPTTSQTGSSAGQRVANQTPADRMLAVMRDLALAAYPSATGETLNHVTSWVPGPLGVPRVAQPADATEWVLETRMPGARSGLRVAARFLPPDTPASQRTAGTCPTGADPARCVAGTLPDGRAYVERIVYGSGWPELTPSTPVHRHEVTVYDGNIEVAVTEVVLGSNDQLDNVPWIVPVETLRSTAADPRLVPPVPSPLPPLPSYLACRAYPPAAGCPGATTTSVSGGAPSAGASAGSGAPIAGLPTASAGAPGAGAPAGQVLARMRVLAGELLGPDLTEHSGASTAQTAELPADQWDRATSVWATFTDAHQRHDVTISVTLPAPGAPSSGPCERGASILDCQTLQRADGMTEAYLLIFHAGFAAPLVAEVDVEGPTVEVSVRAGHFGVASPTAADVAALTPTHDQLSRVANDPRLRLTAPSR